MSADDKDLTAAADAAGDAIAAAVGRLPSGERELARQGIEAARRAARDDDDYGYLGGLVNMRAMTSDEGAVELAMDVTPNALNRYGYVHGGMLFTLADYAMGATARTLVGEDASTVTLEAKANYLGNVREGQLIARCAALHQTERMIMLETRIVVPKTDELIMIVTGTYYIIPGKRDDG